MPVTLKIHPAIGIARLGQSQEYYLGPTTPGIPANQGGSFRDGTPAKGRKCQAAAFWVFAHDNANLGAEPVLIRAGDNIDGKTVKSIQWTVHLANKKAFWFDFDGLTGSDHVTNPPFFGYDPVSLRNTTPTSPGDRRSQLIIDFGPRTVAAPADIAQFDATSAGGYPVAGPAPGTLSNLAGPVDIDSLGTLKGQPDGSVQVIPAPGESGSIGGVHTQEFANNPGWFDNTSDGPVQATIVFTDDTTRQIDRPSWVVVAPPDAAPGVNNIVSLYDTLFDVGVRYFGLRPDIYAGAAPTSVNDRTSSIPPFNGAFKPSYLNDIYPIISRPMVYAWVQKLVASRHRWDFNALAQIPFVPPVGNMQPAPPLIFGMLRRPEDWNSSDDSFMPVLWGDEGASTWLSLTPTQYHTLQQWKLGNFDNSNWTGVPPAPVSDAVPRAANLDRAALEACAGGGFFPGIELGWIVREPRLYVTPFEFRFKHPPAGAGGPLGLDPGAVHDALYPGDATKRMACPWQADFFECATHWWPAQRPDEVVTNPATLMRKSWARDITSRNQMVTGWHRLGVVVEGAAGMMVERDRDTTLPTP
jgi:hypothetical protein